MIEWPPANGTLVLQGEVIGKPATAGSKRTGVVTVKGPGGRRVPKMRGGRVQTFTADDQGEQGKAFRSSIIDVVRELYEGAPLDVPLALELVEYRPRGSGHFGTGRNAGVLKGSAPAYPAVRPDISKILRAFEDALANVLIREDSRFCRILTGKDFDDGPARVEFRLWTLPATVAERGGLPRADKSVTLPGMDLSPENGDRDEALSGRDADDRVKPVPSFPGLS